MVRSDSAICAASTGTDPAPVEQLERSRAHVWLVSWDDLDGTRLSGSCYDLLDPDERSRCERFRFAKDRAQYVAAHALLRITLSRYADVDPRAWQFRPDAFGKPQIAGPADAPTLRFNLSHTGGLAACIIAAGADVGVDVERMLPDTGIAEATAEFLSTAERAACAELPPEPHRERLYEYWTLKEAAAKACGLGLALPLSAITFEFGPQRRVRASFAGDDGQWQFILSDPTPAHKLAVAVRREDGPEMEIVERTLTLKDLTALAER